MTPDRSACAVTDRRARPYAARVARLALRRLVVLAALAAAPAAACVPTGPAASPAPGPGGVSAAYALLVRAPDLDGQPVGEPEAGARATVAVVFASWCTHCRDEIPVLAELARRQPVRVLGLNYRGHEEYEQRGDAAAVRAFVAEVAPWLRVVPADDGLWAALGRPPKVPTIYVFDRGGRLIRTFDRRREEIPTLDQLEASLPP